MMSAFGCKVRLTSLIQSRSCTPCFMGNPAYGRIYDENLAGCYVNLCPHQNANIPKQSWIVGK